MDKHIVSNLKGLLIYTALLIAYNLLAFMIFSIIVVSIPVIMVFTALQLVEILVLIYLGIFSIRFAKFLRHLENGLGKYIVVSEEK